VPGTFTYQLAAGETQAFAAGSTIKIAGGAVGMFAEVSPDLPPGRSLAVAGNGDVTVTAAPDAPPANLHRPWVIEVMNTEQATARILRTGELFGAGQAGGNKNIQFAMTRMQDGDILEISPGAIWIPGNGDGSFYLEGGCLHVWKSCTIRNMPGRGRWRLAPRSTSYVNNYSGIVIREPNQTYSDVGDNTRSNPRKTIVIEGFDFDNWGITDADSAVRMRENGPKVTGTYNGYTASVTLRNFKIGKKPYFTSASGFSGIVETLIIEDGHLYDCAGANSGQDHNAYISARTLQMRGVRFTRSRANNADGSSAMDGHMLKVSAVNATIEGCVFEADPVKGDNTHHIQMKAGGNFVIRGCLFIDSLNCNAQGRGPINMCKELSADGVSPNYEWWASSEGNSLLVEKCVFIGHYGRGAVYFFPQTHSFAIPAAQMSAVTIRDNIGMITPTPTVLAPFSSAKWILNDPFNGPAWSVNNSEMAYVSDAPGFNNKPLFGYARTAGPIAVPRSVSTYRFVYPHGFEARADSFGGLG